MRILIIGDNLENYYAKVHESYRTGLRALFETKCWGKGYPLFNPNIDSFIEIKDILFGEKEIDLLLLQGGWEAKYLERGLEYKELDKITCKKAIMLCDFWSEAEWQRDKYVDFIEKYGFDYIFSYFRMPLHLWENLEIGKKLIWFPPSFDPSIFNDWKKEKRFDVGNLNAGIFTRGKFYPERYDMHQKLLGMKDIKYFYEKHPGTGILEPDTPLIGKRFSEAINECKIFVTTGNMVYRNFAPKYVEIMASGSCLFANKPLDADVVGLIDGFNYVEINENNICDKVRYYLKHDNERLKIVSNAYQFVMEKYSCYAQANYLYKQLVMRMNIRLQED